MHCPVKIAGAALDVFSSEPIAADHPFITELDNVVITPHLAGATYDAIDNHTHQLVEDVKLFLEGKPLSMNINCNKVNIVQKEKLNVCKY